MEVVTSQFFRTGTDAGASAGVGAEEAAAVGGGVGGGVVAGGGHSSAVNKALHRYNDPDLHIRRNLA